MPRQIRQVGGILEIPLGDGTFCYAKALQNPLYGFFDLRVHSRPPISDILVRPFLFKVWVMRFAETSGRWKRIGKEPISAAEEISPIFFKSDALHPERLSIYWDGVETPTTASEIRGLECAAVWDPEHVEERLRDHYSGQPNKWVQSLRSGLPE